MRPVGCSGRLSLVPSLSRTPHRRAGKPWPQGGSSFSLTGTTLWAAGGLQPHLLLAHHHFHHTLSLPLTKDRAIRSREPRIPGRAAGLEGEASAVRYSDLPQLSCLTPECRLEEGHQQPANLSCKPHDPQRTPSREQRFRGTPGPITSFNLETAPPHLLPGSLSSRSLVTGGRSPPLTPRPCQSEAPLPGTDCRHGVKAASHH